MINHFDEPAAATYDQDVAEMFDPALLEPTVDLLADLAGDLPALEFAIGTGRVALPLSRRGVRVSGIELSQAMVDRLRSKPGADDVAVALGDMSSTRMDGQFGLVYLVFNTISNLLTQDAQVDCFRNAAAHLAPGGCFLVEVGVPVLQKLPTGETYRVFHHDDRYLGFDEYDVLTQRMWSHHYTFDGSSYRRNSVPFRYAWPAELDLMACLAGMRLVARWGDWHRHRFTAESTSHVSVWQLPDDPSGEPS